MLCLCVLFSPVTLQFRSLYSTDRNEKKICSCGQKVCRYALLTLLTHNFQLLFFTHFILCICVVGACIQTE